MKRTLFAQSNGGDDRGRGVAVSLLSLFLFWLGAGDGSRYSARLVAAEGQRAAEETAGNQTHKEKRKEELEEMRRRAQSTTVWQLRGADKIPAELVPEPVLRFDSQYHGAIDATLWLYGVRGRPLAAQSVVCWRRPGFPKYSYCLASLSDGLIEARWRGDRQWLSTKPGIALRVLPDGPRPAATENGRMRQMKEAVRRFTAARTDKFAWGDVREEDRVLVQPMRRYRDPDSGLQDGAIFAFIGSGTAPDFVFLLELRGADLEHASWNYGAQRTTTGELHLRLDGKEVWSVPQQHTPGRSVYDVWLTFFPIQQEMSR